MDICLVCLTLCFFVFAVCVNGGVCHVSLVSTLSGNVQLIVDRGDKLEAASDHRKKLRRCRSNRNCDSCSSHLLCMCNRGEPAGF